MQQILFLVTSIFCVLSSVEMFADVKTPNATLTEPAVRYNPSSFYSKGDTYMHAWGSLPNANSTQQDPVVYVDYVTQNDGYGWYNGTAWSCPNGQNITFSYFANATDLTSPTLSNCMTDFGGEASEDGWTDGATWKSAGVTSINGVLYLTVLRQLDSPPWTGTDPTIMMSTNGGASWCYASASDCTYPSNNGKAPASGVSEFCVSGDCPTRLVYIHFVQYEEDGGTTITTDDQNNYIYGFASDLNRANYYLMRIARSSNLQVATNWQYYTGPVSGAITTSSYWTGYGPSGSNKTPSCSGSAEPDCGATIVFNSGAGSGGSNGGPIYVSTDFGYFIGAGYGDREFYSSQSLTGGWTSQAYAAGSLIPSGWSPQATPIIDDFPEPVLSTMSLANEGESDATATFVISSSGDYTNTTSTLSTNNYAMFTQTMTLYKQDQGPQYYCAPATAFPSGANYESVFDNDTWYANPGPTEGIWDASGNYGLTALPTNLKWDDNGLGFPTTASTDVFKTPYTADVTGDFTLLVVYNRSDAVNNGGNYERIADKSDGGGGLDGFAIQRNGTTANEWCVYYNDAAGGCDSNTGDFPDGQNNLMVVRKLTSGSTSTLSVWNSNSSPTSPLLSYSLSGVAAPTNSTNLFIGNSQQLNTPLTGTILGFAYYNTGLSDTVAAQAQTAMEDYMYCVAREITLPGVTGNN
jgi:hypothetical protein